MLSTNLVGQGVGAMRVLIAVKVRAPKRYTSRQTQLFCVVVQAHIHTHSYTFGQTQSLGDNGDAAEKMLSSLRKNLKHHMRSGGAVRPLQDACCHGRI